MLNKIAPLTWLGISFCLGILFEAFFNFPFLVLFFLCILLIALSAIYIADAKSALLVYFIFFVLAAALFKQARILPENHIARIVPYIHEKIYLEGEVVDDPFCSERKCRFNLKADWIYFAKAKIKTEGNILVNVYKKGDFNYGQYLLLEGVIRKPVSFGGDFDYRKFLENKGIYAILNVSRQDKSLPIKQTHGFPLKYFAYKARDKIRAIFTTNLEDLQAKVLNPLILGQRQQVPKYINESFIRTGTAHILAISGLNFGIVGFIFLIFLKALGIRRHPRYIITIFFLIFYCFLTGMPTSVVRATVMAVVLLAGFLLQRPANIYNSLSFAALVMLLFNPNQIFDVGFQLSFVSILSIVGFAPKIEQMFPAKLAALAVLKFIIKSFAVSLAAWLGTMPLTAYYFKIISPITVIANLIIVPYTSIVMALGFLLAVSGLTLPIFAPAIGAACNLSLSFLLLITQSLSQLPGAYFYLR